MDFNSLITMVGCLFFTLVLGFIAKKVNIITDEMIKSITNLVLHVGQPFLIAYSIAKQEFSLEKLKLGLMFAGLGLLMHVVLAAVAFVASKLIKDFDKRKVSEFALLFSNYGFVGFPLIKSLMGDIGLFYGAFFLIGFHITVWTWGVSIFARKREDIKLTPKKIILNYGTIPCLIGLAFYLTTLKLPPFLATASSYLADMCTPLTMLIAGALIANMSVKQIFGNWQIYFTVLFKLLVNPILICLITKLIGLDNEMIIFLTAMASMPCASLTTMFAKNYETEPEYASVIVGVSTVLCAATIPLNMYLLELILAL